MQITPEVVSDFRQYFNGQFSDAQKWSDALLKDVLCQADSETGVMEWGGYKLGDCHNFKRRGMYHFAAAYLSAFYGGDPEGGIPTEARLNTFGKSVGDESIQYRVAAMMDAGNDFLTYTVYGQEFYRMRKRAYRGARAV